MNSGLSLGSLPIRNFAISRASNEYSVAYFGFEDHTTMEEFIAKYNKFVVEVDKKGKYYLQVTRALYQTMPSYSNEQDKKQNASLNTAKDQTKNVESKIQ